MKHKLATLLICMSIGLTGCTNKTFNTAVEQGNESLANKDYIKAEASFRLALAEKNDESIFKLNEQTSKIISIQGYIKNKDYDKALDECKSIEKDGFSNDLIKKDVSDLKKEISDLQEKLTVDEDKKDEKVDVSDTSKDDTPKETSSEDPIEKAKNYIYKSKGLSSNSVKLIYQPSSNLGTIISNDIKDKYYVFTVENLSDGTEWDSYLIVDKSSFKVLDMDMYGNVQQSQSNNSSSNQTYDRVAVSSNQIQDGISSKKALSIIENAYASRFVYTGENGLNGIVSDEVIYNPNTGIEGYAYLFEFREISTGTKYIGEVYGDGSYRLLCNEY